VLARISYDTISNSIKRSEALLKNDGAFQKEKQLGFHKVNHENLAREKKPNIQDIALYFYVIFK
jgi:hypothetical protein